jgi:HAD superfamily hydrolase (TIGR01509 family)
VGAVIFDFDGTILDSETPEYESHRRFCAEHGVHLAEEKWCECVGVVSPAEHWFEWLCARVERAPSFERYREATRAYFQEHVRMEPMPGVTELLGSLVAAGVPRGVASSASSRWVQRALDEIGLSPLFDAIVTGDQVRRGKPHPDVYLEAARRLGVAPASCVAIEDSGPGIASARAAGMRTIVIPHALTRRHDLAAADLQVSSAAELSVDLMMRMALGSGR